MNFEDFRKDLESKLTAITELELQEYRYDPVAFGSGILGYRIKGRNHKFQFDGRENELTWFVSNAHEKYSLADFKEIRREKGLELSLEELRAEIGMG